MINVIGRGELIIYLFIMNIFYAQNVDELLLCRPYVGIWEVLIGIINHFSQCMWFGTLCSMGTFTCCTLAMNVRSYKYFANLHAEGR